MRELAGRGCSVTGVEIDEGLVRALRSEGLNVTHGAAERLPIDDDSVDAIVCSVVLPYTDEALAIREWARVLKPGGFVNVTSHGVGYGVHYLLRGESLPRRVYGFRMLLNTLVYRATGRRLPGYFGDSICQGTKRLQAHCKKTGLTVVYSEVAETLLGFPRFHCHRLSKPRTDNRPTHWTPQPGDRRLDVG